MDVEMVPIPVTLGGRPFDETVESVDGFYDRLRVGTVATTSQPSPADFAAAYDRAADRGATSVVSIHLDRRVSGTVTSAEMASRAARLPVTVVDTGTLSFGVAVCVRAAARVATEGGSAHDAAEAASRLGAKMENVFIARAAPGGRVPAATNWALMRFADGATATIGASESVAEAVEQMAQPVLRSGAGSVAVGHAGSEMEGAADTLAHRILGAETGLAVERYRVGASVGAHTGPESLGAFWWPTP